jgi:hypothetical protein
MPLGVGPRAASGGSRRHHAQRAKSNPSVLAPGGRARAIPGAAADDHARKPAAATATGAHAPAPGAGTIRVGGGAAAGPRAARCPWHRGDSPPSRRGVKYVPGACAPQSPKHGTSTSGTPVCPPWQRRPMAPIHLYGLGSPGRDAPRSLGLDGPRLNRSLTSGFCDRDAPPHPLKIQGCSSSPKRWFGQPSCHVSLPCLSRTSI